MQPRDPHALSDADENILAHVYLHTAGDAHGASGDDSGCYGHADRHASACRHRDAGS
jgi:hypothetical protein